MPLLQVRNFPKELYEALSQVASSENRSIPQQTIVLLRNALGKNQDLKIRRQAVLQRIDELDIKKAKKIPDPVQLVREDRDR